MHVNWPTLLRLTPEGTTALATGDGFGVNPWMRPPTMRQVRQFTVLLLALTAFGATACSTTTSSSPPTTSATTATSSPPATTSSSGPMCGGGQIAVSIQTSFVGAGSAAEELGFLNVSQSLCTLHGYPGVAALNLQGQEMAQAGRGDTGGGPPAVVNLSPGQLAEALIQGSDGSAQKCGSLTRSFLVTPPNTTRSTHVTASGTSAAIGVAGACPMSIGPVTAESPQPTPSG